MTTVRAGFVNAHTHVYSALTPLGMPAPDPPPRDFAEILERVWWRLDRAIDEDALMASARLYAAEAALAGTTALIDHHESPRLIAGSLDLIADACEEVGVRAVLCFGATERNAGRGEAEAGLAECRRFVADNRRPLVRGIVGLHASFTVSDETLDEAGRLCRELRVPLHIHVAEDQADVSDANDRGYAGPLERLLACGALPAGSVLAHGVRLDPSQAKLVGARRCWLVQNPRSNEGNRVGYPRALWASDRVALGTDGYPSDMRAEQAALECIAAIHAVERDPVPALRQRLEAGLVLAAELLGPEAAEDRIELEAAERGGPESVRRVVVAGRAIVEDGRLTRVDLEEIRARAREQAALLWRRMERL